MERQRGRERRRSPDANPKTIELAAKPAAWVDFDPATNRLSLVDARSGMELWHVSNFARAGEHVLATNYDEYGCSDVYVDAVTGRSEPPQTRVYP